MKQLGKYKKFIIAAAIIQSIIVVLMGYSIFKAKKEKQQVEIQLQDDSSSNKSKKMDG